MICIQANIPKELKVFQDSTRRHVNALIEFH
jgi:hypothetical protein